MYQSLKFTMNVLVPLRTGNFYLKKFLFPTLLKSFNITMASSGNTYGIANYEDVVAITKDKSAYLIDVREAEELKETGTFPNSVHIPLGEVENALSTMSPGEFKSKYGCDKPEKNTPLVFSCKAGKRGEKASLSAVNLGYNNVRNYAGAWMDWESKSK